MRCGDLLGELLKVTNQTSSKPNVALEIRFLESDNSALSAHALDNTCFLERLLCHNV